MTDIVEYKRLIRKQLRAKARNISRDELYRQAKRVFSQIERLPLFADAVNIAAYSALRDELPTLPFLARWNEEMGKNVWLPRVNGECLDLVKVDFNDGEPVNLMKMPPFDILEPIGEGLTDLTTINLFIVPGMAFDRERNRLGRGKGYYDRLLADIEVPLIGVARDNALFDAIPHEPHDRKMDFIITSSECVGSKRCRSW